MSDKIKNRQRVLENLKINKMNVIFFTCCRCLGVYPDMIEVLTLELHIALDLCDHQKSQVQQQHDLDYRLRTCEPKHR